MSQASAPTSSASADLKARSRKRVRQVLLTLVVQALMLFLSRGTLAWWQAWAFLGLYLVGIGINAILMLRFAPETIALRAETAGMKPWDRIIGGIWAVLYFIVMLVVAGFDVRFGWKAGIGAPLLVTSYVLFLLGGALFSWAMISNKHFSTVVRIQEGGHTVCETGPYQFVRHPGYVGAVLQSLTVPLMLESRWALIPGILAAALIIVRTALEDRTLKAELPGYPEYAQRVRFRLIPGLW